MKAQVGDRLVKDGADSHRVCEIIGLHHADGSPPYVVRWLSDGHIALLYPGPYMRLVRRHPAAGGPGRAEPGRETRRETRREAGRQDSPGDPAASGGADGGRAAGRARGRAPAPARRWAPNPFIPLFLASPWPSRGVT